MCLPSPLPYIGLIAVSVMQLPLKNVTQPQDIYNVKIVFVLLQPVLFNYNDQTFHHTVHPTTSSLQLE